MHANFGSRVVLLATLVLSCCGSLACADVLTFEDLPDDFGNVPIGVGAYAGLTWSNFNYVSTVANFIAVPNSGYVNGAVSPTKTVYNSGGFAASIAAPDEFTTFDFNSAYVTAAWNIGLNVHLEGYLEGNLLYTQNVTANNDTPTFVNFGFTGIDFLLISSSGGTKNPNVGLVPGGVQFVLDNVTIGVPEPATLALSAMGILGLLAFRRQRRAG